MSTTSRLRDGIAVISAGLLATWLVALSVTVKTAADNHYIAYGFSRTIFFIFQSELTRFLVPVVGIVLMLALTILIWARRRGRAIWLLTRLLAGGSALALFLRLAYIHNKFRFSRYWFQHREIGGIPVPKAFFQPEVWWTHLLILLAAIATAVAVWLVLRFTIERRPAVAARLWGRLGRGRAILLAILLVVVPQVVAPLLRQQVSGRPNFLLVSIDTLRADRLGAYGYHRDTSPEMDRLATESFLFEWAISPAPNTPPAHMSMFTSLYPTVHGFTGGGDRLAGWRLTLAEYLREAGYRTRATTDGGLMRGWFGFNQGFERYSDSRKGIAESVRLVWRWLDRGLSKERFFLFIHCYDVHSPYSPPHPYLDRYTDPDYDGGFHPGSFELEVIRRAVRKHPESDHGLSPADVAYISDRYDEGIPYADHWMRELLTGLDSRGLLENTWLIITSDHGEEFTEHGSVLHEKLYHTVTHVPLIIRPPGPSRPGRRIQEIVELTDLMPTIFEIAGIAPVSDIQGHSLTGLMSGDATGWKNVAYSEHPWSGKRRAVTTPSLRILTSLAGREFEVYAYHEDPLEQSALHQSVWPKDTPELVRALLDWSAEQLLLAAGEKKGAEPVFIDEATREELRCLGYLQ